MLVSFILSSKKGDFFCAEKYWLIYKILNLRRVVSWTHLREKCTGFSISECLVYSVEEADRLELFQQKNEMQCLAYSYRVNGKDISQDAADNLNQKYQAIVSTLENTYGDDLSSDCWINFNSFVPTNKYYKQFSY